MPGLGQAAVDVGPVGLGPAARSHGVSHPCSRRIWAMTSSRSDGDARLIRCTMSWHSWHQYSEPILCPTGQQFEATNSLTPPPPAVAPQPGTGGS